MAEHRRKVKSSVGESSKFYRRGSSINSSDVNEALKKRKRAKNQAKIDLRKNELTNTRRKIIRAALLLIVIVWFVSRQFVTGVSVNSNDESKNSQVEVSANTYLNDNSLSKFKPLLNEARLSEYLKQSNPLIDSVSASAPLFSSKVSITVEYRSPFFYWTDERRSQSYVVDNRGVIVESANNNDGELIAITDKTGFEPTEGEAVLSANDALFISDLDKQLSGTSLKVESYEATDIPKEFLVFLSNENYYLKTTSSREARDQVADLKPVLRLLKGIEETPSKYIDLRVSDKVFYK